MVCGDADNLTINAFGSGPAGHGLVSSLTDVGRHRLHSLGPQRAEKNRTRSMGWSGRRETHTVTARFAIPCNNARANLENSVANPRKAAVPSVIVNYFHALGMHRAFRRFRCTVVAMSASALAVFSDTCIT